MSRERLTLFTQMLVVVVLSVVVMSALPLPRGTSDTEESRVEGLIDSRLNGQQLQVLPANGRPSPIDLPLQSPGTQNNQEAQGDLQQQDEGSLQRQRGNPLQPSAGSEDLPDGFDF